MYIGNKNTKRLHALGCRAIPQIKKEHKVQTDDVDKFPVVCHYCFAGSAKDKAQTNLDEF